MSKIHLSEARIQGNLKDIEQVYKVNYMPQEPGYCDKIELAILLELKDKQEGAYRSLRFQNPAQLKGLIINLIKAYFIFARQRKEITPDNFRFKENKFFNDIIGAFKQ